MWGYGLVSNIKSKPSLMVDPPSGYPACMTMVVVIMIRLI